MKKRFVFIMFFFLFFVSSPGVNAQTIVPSQITSVTLFTGQALVKREASATVGKGLNELFLEMEAFHVDKDSVTAKVYGSGDILSVQLRDIPVKESPQENIKVLEQKIDQLKKSKKILSNQKILLGKKERFLGSLIDFSESQMPKEIQTHFPKTEDLDKTLLFIGSSFEKIYQKKESLDASIEEVDKKIKLLEKELATLRVPAKKARKVIEILFNAKHAHKIRIEADYLTKNAYWKPLYNVSVPSTLSEIDLTMFSKIRQKTGEDWKHVALSISNVIPLSGVHLPSLSSWLIDIPRPRAKIMRKPSRVMVGKAAPETQALDIEASLEEPMEEAAFAVAKKSELPLSFEYKMPQPLDIESRDKETILPLFLKKLKGDFYYYAIPKQSALTFLVCKAKADKELLSGPLNLYFGGRYIGKTFLDEKKAGEEFHLSLGADRAIMVKKEKVRDNIKETFFKKIERDTVIREFAYKITVENLKSRSVLLKVLDNIPVSRTDRIVVKDINITPEPAQKNYQDREGVMVWEHHLNPEEKQEINIAFVVTYPKDVLPIGLFP